MATTTPNLQLTKPAATDFYDVAVGNENLDKIDTKVGSIDETVTTLESDVGDIIVALAKNVYTEVTEEITTSQTWTVPDGVTEIEVRLFGGGGSGGFGAGGGGGHMAYAKMTVTPGTQYAITIGAGGAAPEYDSSYHIYRGGNDGGATSFGNIITAKGGTCGGGSWNLDNSRPDSARGGNGGTGGGAWYQKGSSLSFTNSSLASYGGGGGVHSTIPTNCGAYGGNSSFYNSITYIGDGVGGKHGVNIHTGTYYGADDSSLFGGGGGGYYANGGDGYASRTNSSSSIYLAGGGGGGWEGGDGGSASSYHGAGGGGGYGPTKLAGNGKNDSTTTAGYGGKGYGAGGGGGAPSTGGVAGYAGKGAPGICVIKYKKGWRE